MRATGPRWLSVAWVWLPALAGLALFGTVAAVQLGHGGTPAWWWTFGGLTCAGAFATRERWPLPAVLATLAVLAAARLSVVGLFGDGFGLAYFLLLFLPVLPLISLASRWPVRRSLAVLTFEVIVAVAVSPTYPWSTPAGSTGGRLADYVLDLGVPVMIGVGAWLAGCAILERQRYADTLLDRALTLERTRDAEAARVVAEERAQVARELHDVITHTVAVMVVQASAASAVWERDPARARVALDAVQESGRTVMSELRGVLAALGSSSSAAEDGGGPRRAQDGLEGLPRLLAQVEAAGLRTDLTVRGPADALPASTSASLLRIAQEAVTNVLRHAGAIRVAIDLEVGPDAVELSIRDDGIGIEDRVGVGVGVGIGGGPAEGRGDGLDPGRRGGRGVIGMRERAALLGGSLDIGSAGSDGGTVVRARVPLPVAAATARSAAARSAAAGEPGA